MQELEAAANVLISRGHLRRLRLELVQLRECRTVLEAYMVKVSHEHVSRIDILEDMHVKVQTRCLLCSGDFGVTVKIDDSAVTMPGEKGICGPCNTAFDEQVKSELPRM